MKILEIKDLNIIYQGYKILSNISFLVEKGDYIAIVGPNGAGKTTLIKAILGLIDINSGKISLTTDKIGYLQQRFFLNDPKFPANVKEIVKSGLLINKKFPKFYSRKDNDKVENILTKLDIKELENKIIGKLSGGEFQKVLLARALISNPEILFLDEPTTALDPVARDNFYNLIKDLNEKENLTILLVSHDIGSVGKYAKKILYLDQKLIFYGTFDEFCKSPDMTCYFGDISQHFICQRHN
ncbi:MAG TPA: metal ABC transporter ATP-binding protein [Spirochaetota bacterium]|nr:metal ABC transporter ATP-binding protein [Spirochaetota bacterium]HOL57917.1 metal ABC transporter ATP-binding protein [Spirochaetota bacterium]HPP03847.1 metal ABC transporter ATP-binding protein [Spirochaetota bacterium]